MDEWIERFEAQNPYAVWAEAAVDDGFADMAQAYATLALAYQIWRQRT